MTIPPFQFREPMHVAKSLFRLQTLDAKALPAIYEVATEPPLESGSLSYRRLDRNGMVIDESEPIRRFRVSGQQIRERGILTAAR